MASNYRKLLSGEKVLCTYCKKGYIKPVNTDIPIEKVNTFKCDYCGMQINITRKLKLY